jgi:hypothetical protein
MPQPASNAVSAVPRLVILIGSVAVVFHFLAVISNVLAAPSGPWVTPGDPFGEMAMPPRFALGLGEVLAPNYLKPIKMVQNYHFLSNQTKLPEVYFEAKLSNETNQEIATQKLPDEHANFWVRHRYSLLARGLGGDMPFQPMEGEAVGAPGQSVPDATVWSWEGKIKTIESLPQHLVPRNRDVLRPSELARVLAKSYARYLSSSTGAVSVEVIRYSRYPIPHNVLFMGKPPPDMLEPVVASFGKEQAKKP